MYFTDNLAAFSLPTQDCFHNSEPAVEIMGPGCLQPKIMFLVSPLQIRRYKGFALPASDYSPRFFLQVVAYVYELVDGDVKVDKIEFSKTGSA